MSKFPRKPIVPRAKPRKPRKKPGLNQGLNLARQLHANGMSLSEINAQLVEHYRAGGSPLAAARINAELTLKELKERNSK